jgi:mono/diheme cytochrome c family protein
MKRLIAALSFSFIVAGTAGVALADGAEVWKKKCTTCHGADGKGQTKMGEKLKIKDLTTAESWKDLDDAKIEKTVKDGVQRDGKDVMPALKDKLTADEIKLVVGHVNTFKPAK